jgi:hypothetical protein
MIMRKNFGLAIGFGFSAAIMVLAAMFQSHAWGRQQTPAVYNASCQNYSQCSGCIGGIDCAGTLNCYVINCPNGQTPVFMKVCAKIPTA